MIYAESLPRIGPGSFKWFESVFNYKTELNRVLTGLTQGFNPKTVIDWFQREVTTFLTERAVGQTALTIQPPTHYSIEIIGGEPSVVELHVSEYGDLADNFLTYDHDIPQIAIGLNEAFKILPKLQISEGIVIFSSAANYEGSTSDVINIFTVENHIAGKTKVISHFLFLNRKLNQEEREHWLILHKPDANSNMSSPRQILAHPQLVGSKSDGTPLSPEEYIDWMNMAFVDRFGKPLFAKPQDETMSNHISEKVSERIHVLFDILRNKGANALYLALWKMVEGSQKHWAENNHFEPKRYWWEILLGFRQLSLGFHPADGSTHLQFGGTKVYTAETKKSGHCKTHGDYEGDHCPECHKHIES